MVAHATPSASSAPNALWAGLHADEDFLRLSDERQFWLNRCLTFWSEGYAAAERDHADDYAEGFHDGAMERKRFEHDIVEAAQAEVARWGPLGRGRFGDPRPGDYTGGPVRWDSGHDLKRAG